MIASGGSSVMTGLLVRQRRVDGMAKRVGRNSRLVKYFTLQSWLLDSPRLVPAVVAGFFAPQVLSRFWNTQSGRQTQPLQTPPVQ